MHASWDSGVSTHAAHERQAKKARNHVPGFDHDVIRYNVNINSCRKGLRWQEAERLLWQMGDAKLTPITASFNTAASVCLKSSQWERALNLLSGLSSFALQLSRNAYSTVINCCDAGQQWEAALSVLPAMREAGLELDVVSYSAAINAMVRAYRMGEAEALLSELRLSGVEMDLEAFLSAINSLEKGGQWEMALDLLRGLPSQDAGSEELNTSCYNSAILATGRAVQWSLAMQIFQELDVPDRVSYLATIESCKYRGRWEQAIALFEASLEARVETTVEMYNALASACGSPAGRWEVSLSLLVEAGNAKLRVDCRSFDSAISACSTNRRNRWEWALQILRWAQTYREDDNICYASAISACRYKKEWERALSLLRYASSTRVALEDAQYHAAIFACEERWQIALQLLAEMRQATLSVTTWSCNAASNALKIDGPWQLGVGLLREAWGSSGSEKRRGRRRTDTAPNAITYTNVIMSCLHDANWEHALALLCDMDSLMVLKDAGPLGATMWVCSESGVWQWALRLMATEFEKVEPSSMLYTVAMSCMVRGPLRWEWALEIFAKAPPEIRWDARCVGVAIEACAEFGHWEKSMQLFREMEEMDSKAEQPMDVDDWLDLNAVTMRNLIQGNKQVELAVRLYNELLQRSIEPDFQVRSQIIQVLPWEQALAELRDMLATESRTDSEVLEKAFHGVVAKFRDEGAQWERALCLMQEMLDRGLPPSRIHSGVMRVCTEAGQWSFAMWLMTELTAHLEEEAAERAAEHGGDFNETDFNQKVVVGFGLRKAVVDACARNYRMEHALRMMAMESEEMLNGLRPEWASPSKQRFDRGALAVRRERLGLGGVKIGI